MAVAILPPPTKANPFPAFHVLARIHQMDALDKVNAAMADYLQQDGRLSNAKLAEQLALRHRAEIRCAIWRS
jgi:hypothetical protein